MAENEKNGEVDTSSVDGLRNQAKTSVIFNTSLNGFNRNQVKSYIQESEKRAQQKERTYTEQLNAQRQDNIELQNKLHMVHEECDAANATAAGLKDELDRAKEKIAAFESEREADREEAQKKEEEVEQLLTQLQSERDAALKQVDELSAEISKFTDDIKQLRAEVTERTNAESVLKEKNKELENIIRSKQTVSSDAEIGMAKRVLRLSSDLANGRTNMAAAELQNIIEGKKN